MPGQGVKSRNLTLRSHFGADRHPTLTSAQLYVALFEGDPTITGVEPSSVGGYARVAKANDATLWGTISGTDTTIVNGGTAGEVAWPALTALWSQTTLTHWAVFDNAAGGTMLYWGKLGTPITVTGVGDQPRLPKSTWVVSQVA